MQPVGCSPGTMVKRPNRKVKVRKAHVKYESIRASTVVRYKVAVRKFFAFLAMFHLAIPGSFEDLDSQAGEYINFLYLDDRPLSWANDFLCGLKRLYPRSRRHLDTASSWFRFWQKGTVRHRALALTGELARAMAAIAFLESNRQLGTAILLGFVALLRSGELVALKKEDVTIMQRGAVAAISLPASKGALRSGNPELVLVYDRSVVQLLSALQSELEDGALFFPGGWSKLAEGLRSLARVFGLPGDAITPYSLRRGGATWHFQTYCSYDATQEAGRWQERRTAKIYVDLAVADAAAFSLPPWGERRLHRAVAALPQLLQEACHGRRARGLGGGGLA